MTELQYDKKIFENFEIDSAFIEKYSVIEGNSKIFDFWYDKLKQFENRVSATEVRLHKFDKLMESLKSEMQNQFNECHSCASELTLKLKPFVAYNTSQLRANIDFFIQQTTMMLLFKTADPGVYPETLADYKDFRKIIYDVQEAFNSKGAIKYVIKSLFFDDEISIECIARDFPISIRLP